MVRLLRRRPPVRRTLRGTVVRAVLVALWVTFCIAMGYVTVAYLLVPWAQS